MSQLSRIMVETETWKRLSFQELLDLCIVNKEYQQLCDSDYVWRYFIERDFHRKYSGPQPRGYYTALTEVFRNEETTLIGFFGHRFRVIGDRAKYLLENKIPFANWSSVTQCVGSEVLLSVN